MKIDSIGEKGVTTDDGLDISFASLNMLLFDIAESVLSEDIDGDSMPAPLLAAIKALIPKGAIKPYKLASWALPASKCLQWRNDATDSTTEDLEQEHRMLLNLSDVKRSNVRLACVANELFVRKLREAERAYNA